MTPHANHETLTTAPEIKAAPDDVNAAFDTFMEGFEAFKETNDGGWPMWKRNRSPMRSPSKKLGRIDKAMDEQKKLLDRLALKGARPAARPGGPVSAADALEHKAAFEAYIRRGDETNLRQIEAKAMSIGNRRGWRLYRDAGTRCRNRPPSLRRLADAARWQRCGRSRPPCSRSPSPPPAWPPAGLVKTAARPQTSSAQLANSPFR